MTINLKQNYFQLFNVPEAYDLDVSTLAPRYRDIQSAIHPDNFANGSAQEKRLSVQQAALINEAFETLKSPLKRAQYMLSLRGIAINDQSAAKLDSGFLMEQMELRESLSEIPEQAEPFDALEVLTDQVRQMKKVIIAAIQNKFQAASSDDLDAIHSMTHKLQFLDKLLEEAREVEAKLDDAV